MQMAANDLLDEARSRIKAIQANANARAVALKGSLASAGWAMKGQSCEKPQGEGQQVAGIG